MTKEIRKINADIPIIMQTAHSEPKIILEAIKERVHNFILKPINMSELLESINSAAKIIIEEKLVDKQKKEIEQYLDIINQFAIISKTDKK